MSSHKTKVKRQRYVSEPRHYRDPLLLAALVLESTHILKVALSSIAGDELKM